MTDSQKVLIIIPTYEEEKNIIPLGKTILSEVPNAELLFVDDNSPDNTQKKIAELKELFPLQVHLLARSGKLGLGSAYVEGFSWGLRKNFKYLVEMDADFSHPSSVLPVMLKELKSYPVVVGSRYIKGGGTENWNWFRKILSLAGSFYARSVLKMKVRDLTGGFNAWDQKVLQEIDLNSIRSDGYSFQIEIKYRAHKAGFKIKETPIIFSERRAGQSKMSFNIVLEAIFKIWSFRNIKEK